jgi:Tetracyclin repressor-like, C-terminal domain
MVHEHSKRMDRILEEVILQGMAAGEFRAVDAALAAIRFLRACIRSCDPRLMGECAHDPEPITDQMVDFCLAALA